MPVLQVDTRRHCLPNMGGQESFASDWTHPFIALEGGWMSGKTWIGARKLVTLHVWNAFDAMGAATYVPSVVVAPIYQNAFDYDVPALQEACEEAGLRIEVHKQTSEIVLLDLGTRKRPSKIMIRSAERADRITGWEVGAAWGDEPTRWREDRFDPKNDPFIQLSGRVRHPAARFRQSMFTYTNEGDTTRVYEEFRSSRNVLTHALYRAGTLENPKATEFYARQKSMLTDELAKQYLDGDAASLRGGRVYGVFDEKVHVDAGLRLVEGLPLHLSIDFNIDPGMHIEVGQYFPIIGAAFPNGMDYRVSFTGGSERLHRAAGEQDLFTVVHEIHEARMDVRRAVQRLGEMIGQWGGWPAGGWPEIQVFGDATGSTEWAGTGESCYVILRQALEVLGVPYRIKVPRSNPLIVDRVNALNVAMLDIQGRVRWRCSDRCLRLIDDLVRLKRGQDGLIDKKDAKLSHASDAEGYRVNYLRPVRVDRRNQDEGRFSV